MGSDLPLEAGACCCLREGPGLLGGCVITTIFSEAVAELLEQVAVDVIMCMLEDEEHCCSKEEVVCFRCFAICTSADSEKRMLLEFSTATLTTFTEGSGLQLPVVAVLLDLQGAADLSSD